ncbi:MAG: peptide chain release factor N(5)-glutamine methyltransferase [Candidatus Paceibacterota bacterium]
MNQDIQRLLAEKYKDVESDAFFADAKRLVAGEPLAYVIGHVPFLGTTIHLDSRPLIPRPETEYWTEQAIAVINASGIAEPHILDLCAGSGAIGIAVAKAVPTAYVTFAEIDATHLPTIAKNLEANDIPCTRYQVFQSDLFENITGTFDLVLSNPPYIDPAVDRAQLSVKEHEPHRALYGGIDGLELIARIIAAAPHYLNENGQLWLEHEPEQVEQIQELASLHNFGVTTLKDQYGVERFSVLKV